MIVALYLICIATANVLTASFAPMSLFGLLIPLGTLFIGINFLLRDFIQLRYGKKKTYLFIILALLLSGITSFILGDTLNIVYASALSFIVSEAADTEIFSALKNKITARFIVSGVVAGTLDSVIFAFVGLYAAGFIPLAAIPSAIAGQVIVKSIMQIPVFFVSKRILLSAE